MNRIHTLKLCKSTYVLVLGFPVITLCSTLCAQDVPPGVAGMYASVSDAGISDEFNAGSLDTIKWAYRTKGGNEWGTGPDYVGIVSENQDRFVSIKGDWSRRKGSGIASKTKAHFGFYSIRWRTAGINPKWKTPWHPAIWMAGENFAAGSDARSISRKPKNIEIDFVEYWHHPIWHSQTIAWDREDPKNVIHPNQNLRPKNTDFPTVATGWQVHGLEYHPDYLQLWQKQGRGWKPVGRMIPINSEATTPDSLNEAHASPGYWILSNKNHWSSVVKFYKGNPNLEEFRFENSALHVDYFRYHPLKELP